MVTNRNKLESASQSLKRTNPTLFSTHGWWWNICLISNFYKCLTFNGNVCFLMIHNPIARRRFPNNGWTINHLHFHVGTLSSSFAPHLKRNVDTAIAPSHRPPPDRKTKLSWSPSPIPHPHDWFHPPVSLVSLVIGFSAPSIRFSAIHKEGHARLTGL